jgi:hypothetical protein
MLKRHGLSKLTSGLAVAGVIVFGTAVEASGQATPTFTVSPSTATPGQTVSFTGTGWVSCGLVFVTLISPGGVPPAKVIASVTADTFTGFVPGGAPAAPGTYRVTAANAGGRGGCAAEDSFVVAAATTTTLASTTTTLAPTTTAAATTTTAAVAPTSAAATTSATAAAQIPATGSSPLPFVAAIIVGAVGVLLVIVSRLRPT